VAVSAGGGLVLSGAVVDGAAAAQRGGGLALLGSGSAAVVANSTLRFALASPLAAGVQAAALGAGTGAEAAAATVVSVARAGRVAGSWPALAEPALLSSVPESAPTGES